MRRVLSGFLRMAVVPCVVFLAMQVGSRCAEPSARVTVSILPMAEFVERVGGERVGVTVLVRPGGSPATYEPTPGQMAELGRSAIYFRIGVPFENAVVPRIESALPDVKIVDLRKGVALRRMQEAHGHEHGHGHGHEGADPHTWLDPVRVETMSATIRDALTEADPEGAEVYRANCAKWVEDLKRADRSVSETLKPVRGAKLYVFHPSYGYFADRYGLEQEAIEAGGKSPSPRQIAAIVAEARKDGVRVIFAQPQFDQRAARSIAGSIGGAVVTLDPLARDYLKNLQTMATTIREQLGRK